ncbi:hypothetical protein I553_6475 [Mycobacterium xenopi 4042]|uniref:Uncharacterized protein n=1 Tax=Mycobacterium xenopi 4042 TaxID=1299334 RepID=X8BHR7_MYCXE|nr:hypothetical protein I553_6475 [Mycobacterium xenopi 4042]
MELVTFQPEFGVAATYGDVVEEDVAVGMPAAEVVGWSSRNRDPAFGPRLTTSSAEPAGSPSTPETAVSAPASAGASSSLRKSERKTDVVSTVTSSEFWSFSFSVTGCSSLAAVVSSDRPAGPVIGRFSLVVSTVPRTGAQCANHRRIAGPDARLLPWYCTNRAVAPVSEGDLNNRHSVSVPR